MSDSPTHLAPENRQRSLWYRILLVVAALSMLLGMTMAGLGAWLTILGGSVYYLVAGIAIVAACLLVFRGRVPGGLGVFATVVVLTLAWSLWEIAAKGWMPAWGFDLAGRTGVLLGLLIAMTGLHALHRRSSRAHGHGTMPWPA